MGGRVEGLSLLPFSSGKRGTVSLVPCSAGSPVYMLNTAFFICETCASGCPLVSCQKAARASEVPTLYVLS